MREIATRIVEAIKGTKLPDKVDDLIKDMYDQASNTFVVQESTYWDYKDEFPFSHSGDYFGGILRLICAFNNTYGGIVIFGVHDQTRTPGHNKVKINIERVNNSIRQLLSSPIEVLHREYDLRSDEHSADKEESRSKIDILLVPKRPMGSPPVRLVAPVGRYKANTIWMRVGHEVIEPSSVDLPSLYHGRSDYGLGDDDDRMATQSALPASPATLKEFIGRREALDQLYTWLFASDEPRLFLWGRGGSGKSTIAYEFARAVAETCGGIPTKQGQPIDYVVYVSAKRVSLEPISRSAIQTQTHDFANASELYRAILTLVGWTTNSLASLSEPELVNEVKLLADTIQLLLVVDDIDTLTTAGVDPGMDSLYRVFVRSSAGGKVLYTLRNVPTQSLANAVEVRGLAADTEYPAFVSACCKQFKVPEPDRSFLAGPLAAATEYRPLAVEVVIGLRRTTRNYDGALADFKGRQGEQVRTYLFEREYLALPLDNRARLFLAALSLLGRTALFSELESILQFSSDQLSDCVSQTLEMFLQVDTGADGNSTLSLGAATQQYLLDVSKGLEYYDKLRANVQYFKSPFLPVNPKMSQLQFETVQLFKMGDYQRAVELLSRPGYPPTITEHPTFNMLKARAAAKVIPPKYDEARRSFSFAATHGSTDIQGFRDWYWMEKDSKFSVFKPIEVCDLVLQIKGQAPETRVEFLSKKGLAYRDLSVQSFAVDPEKSLSYLFEALTNLLDAEDVPLRRSERDHYSKTREWLADAFRFLFICASRSLAAERSDLVQLVFGFFLAESRKKIHYFDVTELPIIDCVRLTGRAGLREGVSRYRSFLQRIAATFDTPGKLLFRDESVRERIVSEAKTALGRLQA